VTVQEELTKEECHRVKAKYAVRTLVLVQEELTKEERQNSYTTKLLKGVLYVSSCSCSYMHRRSAPSIYIRCNPLQRRIEFVLLKGALYISSCLCSYVCKHSTLSIYIGCKLLHNASSFFFFFFFSFRFLY
jgi:hypothetical protein